MTSPAWLQTAKPGDKIVCINDELDTYVVPGPLYKGGLDGLTRDVVYTISSFYKDIDGVPCIVVCEIDRPALDNYDFYSIYLNAGFAASRFKPVEKRSTESGMRILKGILKNKKASECV